VMSETLATALAAVALLLWAIVMERLIEFPSSGAALPGSSDPPRLQRLPPVRWGVATALGIVLGLAYLCRPTFVVWTGLLVLYLGAWSMRSRRLGPLAVALPLGLVTAVLLGGWTLRNHRQFGHWIWATTHGGYTLLLGNNPSFYRYLRTGKFGIAWDPQDFFGAWDARMHRDPRQPDFWKTPPAGVTDPRWAVERPEPWDEVADDRLAYQAAVETIRRDPGGFVRACLWRIGRLLSPMPQRTGGPAGSAIVAVVIFYCGSILLMLLGGWQLGGRLLQPRWAAPLLLLAALVAVHLFYWTNMRMRAPLVPAMAVVAAAALCRPPREPVPGLQPRGGSALI
jgi:4-amino-4-deoxy-L-arabinose transferase-like glycosyltransferase